MKILFIINGLVNKAGSERVACNLANLFSSELGYNLTIISRNPDNRNKIAFPLNDDVIYKQLSGNSILFYFKLREFLKNNHFDKIIIHNMGRISFLCANLCLPNLHLISLEHSHFRSYPKHIQWLSKCWFKKIQQFIVLTEADKLNYEKKHSNVVKIPNISSYDIRKLNFPICSEQKTIIAIGRFSYQKNFQALLSAWLIVTQDSPDLDWNLEVYGDGVEKAALEEFIENHTLPNIALFPPQSDLSKIYKKAEFLVMSSRYEGLPLVLIEAQSFGLPLVSFDCPHGPAEIIDHNKNGLLVEDQNIEKLAVAMLELINSKEKREYFSTNAKISAERYTPVNILNQWVNKVLF